MGHPCSNSFAVGGWAGTNAGSLNKVLPGFDPSGVPPRKTRFTEMCKRCTSKVREAGTIAHPGQGQNKKQLRKNFCKTRQTGQCQCSSRPTTHWELLGWQVAVAKKHVQVWTTNRSKSKMGDVVHGRQGCLDTKGRMRETTALSLASSPATRNARYSSFAGPKTGIRRHVKAPHTARAVPALSKTQYAPKSKRSREHRPLHLSVGDAAAPRTDAKPHMLPHNNCPRQIRDHHTTKKGHKNFKADPWPRN